MIHYKARLDARPVSDMSLGFFVVTQIIHT